MQIAARWEANSTSTHSGALENTVKSALSGNERSFSLSLTDCWFPEKTYGSLFFPQGTYHALLIRIGQASGRNWWCCLYPQLCYRDAVTAAVSPESEEELRAVLTEAGFRSSGWKAENLLLSSRMALGDLSRVTHASAAHTAYAESSGVGIF